MFFFCWMGFYSYLIIYSVCIYSKYFRIDYFALSRRVLLPDFPVISLLNFRNTFKQIVCSVLFFCICSIINAFFIFHLWVRNSLDHYWGISCEIFCLKFLFIILILSKYVTIAWPKFYCSACFNNDANLQTCLSVSSNLHASTYIYIYRFIFTIWTKKKNIHFIIAYIDLSIVLPWPVSKSVEV